jgi:hypothetical protein
MKFIRDIIKEKRRSEAQDAPVAPFHSLRADPVETAEPPKPQAAFDDDTFDIAPARRADPEEDFDLFAETDEDEDFDPWTPRAADAQATEPAEATTTAEADFEGDFDGEDPFADDTYETAAAEAPQPADTPFAATPVFEDEEAYDDDAFEEAEDVDAPQAFAPEPAAHDDTHAIRDAVAASTRDLPPMPAVTRAERPAAPQPQAMPDPVAEAQVHMPPPAAGRGANRSGRVKTRLLGFGPGAETRDPFAAPESAPEQASAREFPVGWMVVVAGPGRGASFALYDGVSRVGRGDDQTVSLNFGDNSISRENHISIAYDSEENTFYVGHSGKSNLVRLNRKPLLSTEQLSNGDQIRLGETTLRFVALCGEGFSWESGATAGAQRNAG